MQERMVIVISDDLHFVHFAEDILPDYGFRIEAVSKREVVTTSLVDKRPQVVFLDGGMAAYHDELELVERIRQHPAINRTPLVVSSGNRLVLEEKRQELARHGCVILEKPFNLTQLIEAIEQASLQGR
jgi:CheY-like chemotaxis protein